MSVTELVGRLLDHDVQEYGLWRLQLDGQAAIAGWLGRQRISSMDIDVAAMVEQFEVCAREWERQLRRRRAHCPTLPVKSLEP